MDKKKKLYFLIILNLGIWGYLAYAISNHLSGEEDFNFTPSALTPKSDRDSDTITYVLKLDYKDPFLKTEPIKKTNSSFIVNSQNNNKPSSTPKVVAPKVATVPDIKYMGLVQNKTNGTATAMIFINGKSYLVKQGQIIEGICFQTINKDGIQAKMGKEKLTIGRL